MTQIRLNLGPGRRRRWDCTPDPNATWPGVVAGSPDKYPGLMQTLAAMALHGQGLLHRTDLCPRCSGDVSTVDTNRGPDSAERTGV